MPTKIYYLDEARAQPLKVTWGWNWHKLAVAYQGQEIGQFTTTSQLQQGNTFRLPDGRELAVQLRTRMAQPQLEILLDGQPLPGTDTHPQQQFQQARHILWLLVAIHVGLGLAAEFGQFEVMQKLGMGFSTILMGLAFLGFEWWARTRLTPWAFYAAIGLLVVDMLVTILLTAISGSSSSSGNVSFIGRIFLILALMRGAAAVKELRAQREQVVAVPE